MKHLLELLICGAIGCTSIVAEIIGLADWTPGNSIVLYIFGTNAEFDQRINANDADGSLVISYT
jgi:hypothetical protein